MPARKASTTEAEVYNFVFGAVVARLREARKQSQADLAKRLGVTQSTLSRIERGKAEAGPFVFRQLAAVFDYSPDEFTELVDAAYARTQETAKRSIKDDDETPWWQTAIAVVGVVGLIALVAFAVAAIFKERETKEDDKSS